MRTRYVLLFGAAASASAALIGATAATLCGQQADERHRQTYQALSRAFFTFPGYEAPAAPAGADSQHPELVLLPGGVGS